MDPIRRKAVAEGKNQLRLAPVGCPGWSGEEKKAGEGTADCAMLKNKKGKERKLEKKPGNWGKRDLGGAC